MDVSKSHDPFAPDSAVEDPIAALAAMLQEGLDRADAQPRSLEQLLELSKPELQDLAGQAGLAVSGNKEEIAARILEHRAEQTNSTEETS